MQTLYLRMSALLVAMVVAISFAASTVSATEEESPWNHCYYAGSGTNCADIIGNTVHINCHPSSGESGEGVKSYWWALVWCNGTVENEP
jgi:hypothetical protein